MADHVPDPARQFSKANLISCYTRCLNDGLCPPSQSQLISRTRLRFLSSLMFWSFQSDSRLIDCNLLSKRTVAARPRKTVLSQVAAIARELNSVRRSTVFKLSGNIGLDGVRGCSWRFIYVARLFSECVHLRDDVRLLFRAGDDSLQSRFHTSVERLLQGAPTDWKRRTERR